MGPRYWATQQAELQALFWVEWGSPLGHWTLGLTDEYLGNGVPILEGNGPIFLSKNASTLGADMRGLRIQGHYGQCYKFQASLG